MFSIRRRPFYMLTVVNITCVFLYIVPYILILTWLFNKLVEVTSVCGTLGVKMLV